MASMSIVLLKLKNSYIFVPFIVVIMPCMSIYVIYLDLRLISAICQENIVVFLDKPVPFILW